MPTLHLLMRSSRGRSAGSRVALARRLLLLLGQLGDGAHVECAALASWTSARAFLLAAPLSLGQSVRLHLVCGLVQARAARVALAAHRGRASQRRSLRRNRAAVAAAPLRLVVLLLAASVSARARLAEHGDGVAGLMRNQLVGCVDERGAEQQADCHGRIGVRTVHATLLGELQRGRQQRPVAGGQHHSGGESQRGVEQFALASFGQGSRHEEHQRCAHGRHQPREQCGQQRLQRRRQTRDHDESRRRLAVAIEETASGSAGARSGR